MPEKRRPAFAVSTPRWVGTVPAWANTVADRMIRAREASRVRGMVIPPGISCTSPAAWMQAHSKDKTALTRRQARRQSSQGWCPACRHGIFAVLCFRNNSLHSARKPFHRRRGPTEAEPRLFRTASPGTTTIISGAILPSSASCSTVGAKDYPDGSLRLPVSGSASPAQVRLLLDGTTRALGVIQSAVGTEDFLDRAAQALVQIVGLDTGRVLFSQPDG